MTMKREAFSDLQLTTWMEEAIKLARKGAGFVAPNPMVGALVIDGTRVIGRGYHARYGEAHAEVNAINHALTQVDSLEGMTMVVTLEPCSHHGKTPPCCELIVSQGIRRVIVGMKDPNPLVAGRGIEYLKSNGIEVITGVLVPLIKELNQDFIHFIKSKRPLVTMKTAMTLDGKIAAYTGDSKWISGEDSRRYVHRLRQEMQGIMVGINTLITDDPSLTTRLSSEDLEHYQGVSHPVPIIVDSKGRMPLNCAIIANGQHERIIVATTSAMSEKKEEDLIEAGCEVMRFDGDDGYVDLEALIASLGGKGMSSILLEGGGTLNYSALTAGLVNKVISFIAPKFIGGQASPTPVGGKGISKMSEAIVLENKSLNIIGDDIMVEGWIGGA